MQAFFPFPYKAPLRFLRNNALSPPPFIMHSLSRRRRPPFSQDAAISPALTLKHSSPYLDFPDSTFPRDVPVFDSDSMIFDLEDGLVHDPNSNYPSWDLPPSPATIPSYSASPASTSSQLDFSASPPSFSLNAFPASYPDSRSHHLFDDDPSIYSGWLVDDVAQSTSAPIAVPSSHTSASAVDPFIAYDNPLSPSKLGSYSPTLEFAALHPLPHSFGEPQPEPSFTSFPSSQPSQPFWASQLWNTSDPPRSNPSPLPQLINPPTPPTFDDVPTQRQRPKRTVSSVTQLFQSSSAPSGTRMRSPSLNRPYSRRAESVSTTDDREATIRRKRRSNESEDRAPSQERSAPALKSHLRPPKLAPSAWQLYFTDWIQRHQASSTRKLNVAQAAKEAGADYALLTPEEKEPYRRRSLALKDLREKEYRSYLSGLTPDDIRKENAWRTAQRASGKSRKANIRDVHAPRRPLSAYFTYLQWVRSDPQRVKDVFGTETETTRQSVLAATKWRAMTDDERRPFLAHAEQAKIEYETARKEYERSFEPASSGGSEPHGTNINFSVLPFQSTLQALPSTSVKTELMDAHDESESFVDATHRHT
ncbi:hypothetical protein OF83DRAFT_515200 [Amylostereum chailletii]|nr:hypothetical protein OF83DRAFT_515200 [Amylostereum chailletii]